MRELRLNHSIENLTSLKDVGSLLDFEYTNRYINGRKRRLLEGTKENFIKFIDVEIK
jgi:DNA-binding transcriptional regulator WhiA